MLHIALSDSEITPNTGNVAGMCRATAAQLHLIGRLGFRLADRELKRAGLDYWPEVDLVRHESLEQFEGSFQGRILCFSARGSEPYTSVEFSDGDCLLFG